MNRNAMPANKVDPRLWLQVCCKCYEATIVLFLSKFDIDNSCAAQFSSDPGRVTPSLRVLQTHVD
jgi:hypothetical protein